MKKNRNGLLARHPLLIAFVLIALCLTPVMMMRDFTPDNELRYLSIADEAIENGNVFAFTLGGEPYADKPPLYLWIVMLSKLLLGKHSMFLLSLFSLLPAFVIIYVMDKWLGLKDPVDRITTCFMMMTCALFLGMSVFLRMDMLMTMFIVLALYTFYRMYEGEGNRKTQEVMLPVWIFLALFTKGPVGLMMPPLVIICFLLAKRRGREIGRYLGWKTWGIIAGLCAVWFTGVYLDGGKPYLENLLFHQTVGRAVNSFHHKNPFWYYLMTVWYVVAPYCFLLVGAVVASLLKPGKENRSDKEVFFATAVISTTVMLSCFSAKLAIYFSPVMPFMVLLFMELLKRTGWKKWMTWSLAVPVALLAVVMVAAICIRFLFAGSPRVAELLSTYHFLTSSMVTFALLIFAVGLILSLVNIIGKRWNMAILFVAMSILLGTYSASSAMPAINDWIGWGNLCETIPSGSGVATLYVKRAANMRVYLGREIEDYEKDFTSFRESCVDSRNASDKPMVLVTKGTAIARDKELDAFVRGHSHMFVGPYCLVSF
jgi:4-amino-4-deoxy-L-arabinose transferase and related glycosyltransferases of PMT family